MPPVKRPDVRSSSVQIEAGDVRLEGVLAVPQRAVGAVLLAHENGSGRFSPRNGYVAEMLQQRRLATLQIDLLTEDEALQDSFTGNLRFNIPFLAERLAAATDWLLQHEATHHLAIGYLGASTGAGAALLAATRPEARVAAVVVRGGRPDLAGSALPLVKAPTLLIVGGGDHTVLELNQHAAARLRTSKRLEVIPGAGHLFEEPGALHKVGVLARHWFERHLTPRVQEAS